MPSTPISSSSKPVTLLSLPTETLSEIFHYLGDSAAEQDRFNKPPAGRRFPHNVVQVCKKWRSHVESISRFWTTVDIFVDNPHVLRNLPGRFVISKLDKIKVSVIRNDYPEGANDMREQFVVDNIVKELQKHIHRCRSLIFDVLHSSSLPLVNSFSGKSEDLRELRIRCRRGPAGPNVRLYRPPPVALFLCPNLQHIDLHGRAFVEATKIPQWLDSLRKIPRKTLSISDLTLEDAGEYNMRAFIKSLARLGHLATLKLRNVDLDATEFAHAIVGLKHYQHAPASITVQNFDFFGLSSQFVERFFRAYHNKSDVTRLAMTECRLGPVVGLETWTLSLRDMNVSETVLIAFLEEWNGVALELINVTGGITDKLFERLSLYTHDPDHKYRFSIPYLRQLTIVSRTDSLPLSPQALKNMVLLRKVESDQFLDNPCRTNFLPLFSVNIIGSTLAMSHDDRKTLDDVLEFLFWKNPRTVKQPDRHEEHGLLVQTAGLHAHDSEMAAIKEEPEQAQRRIDSPVLDEDCADWDFSGVSVPKEETELDEAQIRCESPVLDGDCADWDFSGFDDSLIGALIPPSAQTQTATSFGAMDLGVKPPSRSPSPFLKDDYCNMDWSTLDVGGNSGV